MLTFTEKLTIIESFPQLNRKNVSLGRVNFQYPESISDKKNIVYHLHPNGNGFVYAGHLDHYLTDEKGMVNIRDYTEDQLRQLLQDAIKGLSGEIPSKVNEAINGEANQEEHWVDSEDNVLVLLNEMDSWNIYFGLNLDATFDSYEEAIDFLKEEGFRQK